METTETLEKIEVRAYGIEDYQARTDVFRLIKVARHFLVQQTALNELTETGKTKKEVEAILKGKA